MGNNTWPNQLYELLRSHDVTQFAYVPDAGHRVLIDRSLADSLNKFWGPFDRINYRRRRRSDASWRASRWRSRCFADAIQRCR